MAHILQVRQSGAVVALKLTLDKATVAFHAEVFKWDDASSSPVRVGERRFTLPQALYKNFTINLLRERIAGTLPPCLPGACALSDYLNDFFVISIAHGPFFDLRLKDALTRREFKGNPVADDLTFVSLELSPNDKESMQVNFVFNLNKNAVANPSASGAEALASPRLSAIKSPLSPGTPSPASATTSASPSAPRATAAQSSGVKAVSGAITYDREYPVNLTISADAGNCYVTVNFGDKEEKYIIAEATLATMTVKELKRKLGKQLPETTDRSTLEAASGSKPVKDSDKLGALGVKGKKGETFKFPFIFELVTPGTGTGQAAPEIEASKQFLVELVTYTQDGHVYLKINCKSEGFTDNVKSAAFLKTMFANFALRDLYNLLKGGHTPALVNSWAVFEMPTGGKIKVTENTPLTKLGISYHPTPGRNQEYNFIFVRE